MRHVKSWIFWTTLLGVFCLACQPPGQAGSENAKSAVKTEVSPLTLEPCRFAAFDEMRAEMEANAESNDGLEIPDEALGEARCGRYEVWENREKAEGRRIGINVIVLPALGDEPAPDPVFLFAGGPGSAVSTWAWVAAGMPKIRERHDIVLVDQRGTGGSNPLACEPDGDDDNLQGFLDPEPTKEAAAACAEKLSAVADLRFYRTLDHADDVNDIRAALGYETINMWGGSYGTRPVLVYLRRHPEHARSAVVTGVAHTGFKYPLEHSPAGQRALNMVFEACSNDEACNEAYPDPQGDLEKVLALFDEGPVTVEIPHPNRDEKVEVVLRREIFTERLRSMMYSSFGAARIPGLLRRTAESGNLMRAAVSVLEYEQGFGEGKYWFTGMWLAVTCTEDIPLITDAEVEAATAGSVLGDYRVSYHREACKVWPAGEIPEGYSEHVRSDVPVLVLSGDYDPVTPPSSGAAAAEHLSNSRHIVGQYGHGASDWDCMESVFADLFKRGNVEEVDTSCLESMELPPWPVPGQMGPG